MTRILVVEPDEVVASDMRASLGQNTDWHVIRVASLMEAIRAAGEDRFDAAVLDPDLPDGNGLDIVDFLRIGSPGIRILLVSDSGDEEVVFHALSHGVGDYLVKDSHLSQELPRRVDALLERGSADGLVDTLAAAGSYDTRPEGAGNEGAAQETSLQRALGVIVGGPILAAGVFDSRGKPVAARLFPGVDPDGFGFAIGIIHGQIGGLWTYAELKPSGYDILVDVDAGLLALTAIPGTFVVAVLMEKDVPRAKALEIADRAARKVFESLKS
ncbi:MAG TPA: response regulator [Candidatus Thermoplasmatota archaeon]|nr:response regulator [Candidatus Thermoplasmatota archaeon]